MWLRNSKDESTPYILGAWAKEMAFLKRLGQTVKFPNIAHDAVPCHAMRCFTP
jgi:hypothetical protein